MLLVKEDGAARFEELDREKYAERFEKSVLADLRRQCEAKGVKFSPNAPSMRRHVDLLVIEALDEAGLLG